MFKKEGKIIKKFQVTSSNVMAWIVGQPRLQQLCKKLDGDVLN